MKPARIGVAFLMGYFLYAMIEILARGYTHWTMALTGGVVLSLLYVLFTSAPSGLPRPMLYLLGALVITGTELAVGVLVNLTLRWGVWDYREMPLNFHGQICLLYSVFWYFLCIPAYLLCRRIDQWFDRRDF